MAEVSKQKSVPSATKRRMRAVLYRHGLPRTFGKPAILWLAGLVAAFALLSVNGTVAAESVAEESTYTFSPRFGTRKTELAAADREQLNEIAGTRRSRRSAMRG